MFLMILTFLGIMATRSTITELMISGNDKVHKQTFYQADGSSELAEHTIFQNAICTTTSGGFTKTDTIDEKDIALLSGSILIENLTFAESRPTDVFETVSDSKRSFAFYPGGDVDDSQPHTNFLNTSKTIPLPGDPMQMISGYDENQNSTGGTAKRYTIVSQHIGAADSESKVKVRWWVKNDIITDAVKSDCEY